MSNSVEKLPFNFCSRRWNINLVGICILLFGLASLIFTSIQFSSIYDTQRKNVSDYEALASHIRLSNTQNDLMNKIEPGDKESFRNALVVSNQLNIPWDHLLRILEAAPMEKIALLSIEPIAAQRQLRLIGEAKDLSTMLDYLTYLQNDSELHQVILMSHHVTKQAGAPVRFQLQANWELK